MRHTSTKTRPDYYKTTLIFLISDLFVRASKKSLTRRANLKHCFMLPLTAVLRQNWFKLKVLEEFIGSNVDYDLI